MSETKPLKQDDATPLKQDEAAPTANPIEPDYVKLTVMMSITLAVGTLVAFGSLFLDSSSKIDSKIQIIIDNDLSWLYLALVALGRTISLLNFAPMSYKNGLKGNIRSNPFYFQTVDDKKTMVLYQEDGTNGMYNRSNRSVQHMVENFGALLASIGPVGYVFPKQTCGFVFLFCAGRIIHQKGYSKGYGSHALGFVFSLLATVGVEGLALIAFLKGQGIL